MPDKQAHEVIPSARRLIHSLRDMGYDFAQAVADVVDNSIEAGATNISIDVRFEGDDSWVRIVDNGEGMDDDQLKEAMRYGSEREYSKEDLGKFGLGLKTASMSQCQCLTVASRSKSTKTDITAYTWDLDHIERTNRWEILPVTHPSIQKAIRHSLKDSHGTVVLWQRLDRILGYQHPYGENARKRLLLICREIEQHLGMVFHRFITGEVRGKRFNLTLNKNPIKPWDPFCRTEAKTKKIPRMSVPLEYEGIKGSVQMEPFILPHQDDFSSPEAARHASGPALWNQQQGFYIYRADRMIQSGGWSGLRANDEHTKLARIALNFSPNLDEAFKINVAKMRVQLPAQIRETMRDAVSPIAKLAREVYDRKLDKPAAVSAYSAGTNGPKPEAHAFQSPHISRNATLKEAGENTPTLTLLQWSQRLLAVATGEERPVIEKVLRRIKATDDR